MLHFVVRKSFSIIMLAMLAPGVLMIFHSNSTDAAGMQERDDGESEDVERKLSLILRSTHERERIRQEIQALAITQEPKYEGVLKTFQSIEYEFSQRARIDRFEAREWLLERLEGKSLSEL